MIEDQERAVEVAVALLAASLLDEQDPGATVDLAVDYLDDGERPVTLLWGLLAVGHELLAALHDAGHDPLAVLRGIRSSTSSGTDTP